LCYFNERRPQFGKRNIVKRVLTYLKTIEENPETGQILVSGLGELHLEVILMDYLILSV